MPATGCSGVRLRWTRLGIAFLTEGDVVRPPSWSPRIGVTVAGLLVLVAVVLALILLPGLLVRLDIGADGPRSLSPVDRAKAMNDARITVLQGVGGTLLLVGVYLTWRQIQVSREGQITERYTRAVEQLGSDNRGVRVGGIYALERIAKDSAADRGTVSEVLTTFVRERATWQQGNAAQSDFADFLGSRRQATGSTLLELLPYLRLRAPDVQAAMTVLGRLPPPPMTPHRLSYATWTSARGTSRAQTFEVRTCVAHTWNARCYRAHILRAPTSVARTSEAPTWQTRTCTVPISAGQTSTACIS